MAEKRGRKTVYDTHIAPRLADIKKWRKVGATVENMCDALGVSKTTFHKYLNEQPEFADAYKKGKVELVMDLRGELARIAFKHTLETKKQYIKQDMETGHKTQYTEITTKDVDGDIAAINLLLKNLDENWSNDPQNLALRRQELELRKAIAAANNFDLDMEGISK
jgi:predicted transcriptional regulator